MLNLRKVIGFIAIIAVAGFVFISCEGSILDEGKPNFPKAMQGTWKGDTENGTLTIKKDSVKGDKGKAETFAGQIDTYVGMGIGGLVLGNKVTFNITNDKITVTIETKIAGTSTKTDVVYPYTIINNVLTIKDTNDKVWFEGTKE